MILIPRALATALTVPIVGFAGSAWLGVVARFAISIWHFAMTFPQSGNGSEDKAISMIAMFTTSAGNTLRAAAHVSIANAVN